MAKKSINYDLPDLDRFLEGRGRKFVTYQEGSDLYGIPSYRYTINIYLEYLRLTHGLTLMTVTAAEFSQANIADFLTWLKSDRNNVATTANHRLSDLRVFCKYLARRKALTVETYEAIREIEKLPDERVEDFTWLSIEDVRDILKSTAGPKDHIRNRFLLSVLYESGARIDEVLSLKL